MGDQYLLAEGVGKITSGVSPGDLALRTVLFVRDQLPAWRDDPDRKEEQAEERLNLQLCKFLDAHARNVFPMVRFDREEFQSGQRRVDLSASPAEPTMIDARLYTIYDPILVIEGKRLPTPSAAREREYVTGGMKPAGGIQRFKLGLHGAALSLAAMVGYVQNGDVGHWHTKVNAWISDLASCAEGDTCSWEAEDTLKFHEKDAAVRIGVLRSSHARTGDVLSNRIELWHLWVEMEQGMGNGK